MAPSTTELHWGFLGNGTLPEPENRMFLLSWRLEIETLRGLCGYLNFHNGHGDPDFLIKKSKKSFSFVSGRWPLKTAIIPGSYKSIG